MTRKKTAILGLAAIAAIVVLALAVVMRPRSFAESMQGDFDPAVLDLEVRLSPPGQQDLPKFTLTPEDDAYWTLVDLLDSQQYRYQFPHPKSFQVLLDYQADLIFQEKNGPGYHLYFVGDETLQFLNYTPYSYFKLAGLDRTDSLAFQQKVLDLLLEAAPEKG